MKPLLIWLYRGLGALLVAGLLLWIMVRVLASFAPFHPVTFGISFSKYRAQALGLDWKETYLSLLDELGPKDIRLVAYWDDIERQPGRLDFTDIDWQLAEAEKRNIKVLMAVGYKLPGWPECHVPEWASEFPVSDQYEAFLSSFPSIITHLKTYDSIWAWQVENEPFFRFGECPTWWVRRSFVEKEIALTKQFDDRPTVLTESGEGDVWLKAGERGDIVGASMYRTIWNKYLRYTYPFNATYYRAKGGLVKLVYGKDVLMHEIQMEPWTPGVPLPDFPLEKQYITMWPERFKSNVAMIRAIGFSPAYLWGAEWWYWLKNVKNDPAMWEEAEMLWR